MMQFMSFEFRVLETEARLGTIGRPRLRRLLKAADAATLVVEAVRNLDDGVMGAACYADYEVIAVLAARDVVVLEP